MCWLGLSLSDYYSSITSHKEGKDGQNNVSSNDYVHILSFSDNNNAIALIYLDFGSTEDTRSYTCLFLDNNLGFGDLWWLLGLVQLSPLFPLLVLYR